MTYYAILNIEGSPIAFYIDSINTIPDNAVSITEEQWREFIDHPGERRLVDGKMVVIKPPPPPPPPIPSITPRQLRIWLLAKGIKEADVVARIATLPSGVREVAQIEWEYATIFERGHEFVAALGQALGLTPEQLDEGFREAATL